MPRYQNGIIIGASIAGLLAARALSDHFERVTIIERDHLPETPDARAGVPQSKHTHALLARGANILEALFPGIKAEMLAAGARELDWGDPKDYYGTLVTGAVRTGKRRRVVTLSASRALIEYLVRERVRKLPNVTFIEDVDAEALLVSEDKGTARGVHIVERKSKTVRDLTADFIVDCSGRTSKAGEWLKALGYEAAQETIINSYVGYATRWYEKVAGEAVFTAVGPDSANGKSRNGGILEVENGKWCATLVASNKDYPPLDEDAYLAFAQSLLDPKLADLISKAKPISPIYGFRYAGSRWLHYEKLSRMPERFAVMGDAFCSFNPVYGQGMTSAAMQAQALSDMLRTATALDGFNLSLQKRIAKVVIPIWTMATGSDLQQAGVEGSKPGLPARMVQKYIEQVFAAMSYDAEVTIRFSAVLHLLKPLPSLFHPVMVTRVFAAWVRRKSAERQSKSVPLRPETNRA